MDFYFVPRDFVINLKIDGQDVTYVFLKGDPAKLSYDRVYFAPSDEIQRVVERFKMGGYPEFEVNVILNKEAVFSHPRFPYDLTYSGGYHKKEEFVPLEEKLRPLVSKIGNEKIRVAVVNGMGGGIGDNLVGMTALNIFYDTLLKFFKQVEIGVFTLRPRAIPILTQETIVNEIYLMPSPVELLFNYDAVVDLSNMTGWPTFKQPMIDFYLQAFSLDPSSVPAERKRCFVKLSEPVKTELEPVVKALKASGRPLLLYHPLSSAELRSVPQNIALKHITRIIEKTNYLVVSLVELPFKHPRFVCLANYSKKGFDYYAYLVSQVDAIITVDTATYHIADTFCIPTVVFFTSIPPEHRISYYPHQKGILIGGKDGKPLIYSHSQCDQKTLAQLKEAWKRFRIDEALDLIEELKEVRPKEHRCPVCGSSCPEVPVDRYRSYLLFKCSECEAEFAHPRKGYDYEKAYEAGKTDVSDYGRFLEKGTPEELYQSLIANPRFEKVKEFLQNLPKKETLLDVGCANGFFVLFAQRVGFDAYGIDASESAISWGTSNFGLKTLYRCERLSELPDHFPERFQVITAFELVEHLEDPLDFLREVKERLLPGGLFVFSTPNLRNFGRALGIKDERAYFVTGKRDLPPDHLTRFSAKTHRILLERSGLELYCQWFVPVYLDDLFRVVQDKIALPNVTVEVERGKSVVVHGEKLKPLCFQGIRAVEPLFREKGLFIVTVARRP